MKAIEIINEVNEIAPNQYDNALKLRWLADLDGKVCRELIRTHEDPAAEAGCAAADYSDPETELLIAEPFARDVYVNYVRAKMAQADGETERYNLCAAAYNAEYQQWAALYNSTTPPKRQSGWRY